MTRLFFAIPFALGAAAILWTAAGFIGSAPLALVVTATIGGVYVLGAGELYRYRQATNTLTSALHRLPERGDDPDEIAAEIRAWEAEFGPLGGNAIPEPPEEGEDASDGETRNRHRRAHLVRVRAYA